MTARAASAICRDSRTAQITESCVKSEWSQLKVYVSERLLSRISWGIFISTVIGSGLEVSLTPPASPRLRQR